MNTTTESLHIDPYKAKAAILSFYDDDLFEYVMTYISSSWVTSVTADSTDSESWFWSEEWQAGERRADQNLKSGRFKDFETIDDVISFLDAQKAKKYSKNKS